MTEYLGVQRFVWLGLGLLEDRDTDGHVDLIAAFTRPGQALLQTVGAGNPNYDNCEENRRRLVAAGIEVIDVPFLPYFDVGGETVAVGYLNLYVCNGAVIVPVWDRFLSTYPEVQFEFHLGDAPVDIVAMGYDAGIGPRDRAAADMIAVRVMGPMKIALVGAPAYFALRRCR